MYTKPSTTHTANDLRIGMVVSRYHESVTTALARGAEQAFIGGGGREDDLVILHAPGTFEIPILVDGLAYAGSFDAIVALGCVITGETTHDRYICESVAHALQRVATESGVPVGFGILTCQTLQQAEARAGGDKGNKGAETMQAVIEAAGELRRLWQMQEEGGEA